MKVAASQRFARILVPTDFSDNAEEALACAISLATTLGSKVTILHVAELPGYAYADHTMPSLDEILPRAQDALDGAVERAKRTLSSVDSAITSGHPAEGIVDYARDHAFDLVVMGTHGRRGLPRALIGSVAERVVRTSSVPVLTVSPRAPGGT